VTGLRERWDAHADDWARFARTPGHDVAHERMNFPHFLELVPPARRATLDVGCGEGRVGAELEQRGHHVLGVDSSERMVELALEHHNAVVADATALPFEDGVFDLAVAYMSLMNMDDLEGATREIGRVLEPGGRLVAAVVHPFGIAGEFQTREADSPYVIAGSYLDGGTKVCESDRDGVRFTFHDRVIPLKRYSRSLEGAGLVIERLREPVPDDAFVADHPVIARRRRVPLFLHFVAVKE
jgi:SAM-dependent methyltransferase